MKKIILFFVLVLLVFGYSCKKNSGADGVDNTKSGTTTITVTGIESSAQYENGDYVYKVTVFLNASSSGSGAQIYEIKLTFNQDGQPYGDITYTGSNAFANTSIAPGGSLQSREFTISGDNNFLSSVDAEVKYRSNSEEFSTTGSTDISQPPILPTIEYFTASTTSPDVNETIVLSWSATDADTVTIFQDGAQIGTFGLAGTLTVNPTDVGDSVVTYKLTATNSQGSNSKNVIVVVNYPDVEYRVSGVREAGTITLSGRNESTVQFSDVVLPFTYTISSVSRGDFLYVSAQNGGRKGTIKVEIYKDGRLYRYAESTGAYVIATASGTY